MRSGEVSLQTGGGEVVVVLGGDTRSDKILRSLQGLPGVWVSLRVRANGPAVRPLELLDPVWGRQSGIVRERGDDLVMVTQSGATLKLVGDLTELLPDRFHATVLGWHSVRRDELHVRAVADRATSADGVFQKVRRVGRTLLAAIGDVGQGEPVWILAVEDDLALVRTAEGTTGYTHAKTLPLTTAASPEEAPRDRLTSGASGRLPGIE